MCKKNKIAKYIKLSFKIRNFYYVSQRDPVKTLKINSEFTRPLLTGTTMYVPFVKWNVLVTSHLALWLSYDPTDSKYFDFIILLFVASSFSMRSLYKLNEMWSNTRRVLHFCMSPINVEHAASQSITNENSDVLESKWSFIDSHVLHFPWNNAFSVQHEQIFFINWMDN